MSLMMSVLTGRPDWAWPSGALDQLLTAALNRDIARAEAAFRAWDAAHDLDKVGFREHRLLAAIIHRHGKALSDLATYPRLAGLQRQLWTRSRLTIRDTAPLIGLLAGQGIAVMLIKGAARLARNPEAQQARLFHDIDLLIRRADFPNAMQAALAAGWQSGSGESPQSLIANVERLRSRNLHLAPLGDADLHLTGFHDLGPDHHALDAALWTRAEPAVFFGHDVFVPCREDQLAMAISHGTRGGFANADWLVDSAGLVLGALDWSRLAAITAERGLENNVAMVLGYLVDRQGFSLPDAPRLRLGGSYAARAQTLLAAKPRADLGLVGKVGHLWARRSLSAAAQPPEANRLRIRARPRPPGPWAGAPLFSVSLGKDLAPGDYQLVIGIKGRDVARRYDYEIKGATRHYAWITSHPPRPLPDRFELAVRLTLPADREPGDVTLSARPRTGRLMTPADPDHAALSAVPFTLVDFAPA